MYQRRVLVALSPRHVQGYLKIRLKIIIKPLRQGYNDINSEGILSKISARHSKIEDINLII